MAWGDAIAEWVPMGPGIEFRLTRPDGLLIAWVQGETGRIMSGLYEGRAALDAIGIEEDRHGVLADPARLNGIAVFVAASLYASKCIEDWRGMEDEDGSPLALTEDNIRRVLLDGPPPGGASLLAPFAAWCDGPRGAAAEHNRLTRLAKDGFAGGFERCAACRAEGDACATIGNIDGELCPQKKDMPRTAAGAGCWDIARTPGLWQRAALTGAIVGLDYGAALRVADTRALDLAEAYACLRAIEAGVLTAEREKAAAETPLQPD